MKNVKSILNDFKKEVTPDSLAEAVKKANRSTVKKQVLLTGVRSDAHTWNLSYLELLLEELGFDVINLGPNVPVESVALNVRLRKIELIVVSSVNGHGAIEGQEIAEYLGSLLGDVPLVIGGLLTTDPNKVEAASAQLINSGYNAVFSGEKAIADLISFLHQQQLVDLQEAQL